MLHEIAKELETALRAKNAPLRVVDDERTEGLQGRERLVLAYAGGDAFTQPISQHRNPPARFTEYCGATLRVYVKSSRAGAARHDHERRAKAVLRLALVCLDDVLRGDRMTVWTPRGGNWVTPDDQEGSATWTGVVYELQFTFAAAVLEGATVDGEGFDSDATPAPAPEATLGGEDGVTITSTTSVLLAGAPVGTTPDTGCGG